MTKPYFPKKKSYIFLLFCGAVKKVYTVLLNHLAQSIKKIFYLFNKLNDIIAESQKKNVIMTANLQSHPKKCH
jgi:hypothetical protein